MAACCACSPPGCCATRISTFSGPPNCCNCTSPRPSPLSVGAHLGEIGGAALRLDLDQRAADEVDAEIEPVKKEQQDRDDRQQRRDRKADAPEAHEVELGVVRDDPQQRDGGMQAHVEFRL